MYIGVRLRKFLNDIFLVLIIFFIGYGNKVIASLSKSFYQLTTMLNASTKYDSLLRLTKDLMGFLMPLMHDITNNLDTLNADIFCCPFASPLFDTTHVNLFGNIDTQWNEPAFLNQLTSRGGTNDMVINISKTFSEWSSGQSNHTDV